MRICGPAKLDHKSQCVTNVAGTKSFISTAEVDLKVLFKNDRRNSGGTLRQKETKREKTEKKREKREEKRDIERKRERKERKREKRREKERKGEKKRKRCRGSIIINQHSILMMFHDFP